MVRSTLLVSLFAAVASSVAAAELHASKTIIPGAYIFELEEGHDPSDFLDTVNAEGKTRQEFDYKLFKGVSVQLNDVKKAEESAMRLAALPVVKNVWPVQLIQRPNPRIEWVANNKQAVSAAKLASRAVEDPKADTFSPHVMTQVDKLRAKGITGKGIKIAVIDSGIDYKHPALGGCFGKGCLVSFGRDFVGDAYSGSNTPVPDADPMDCGGHGTHVAGIIAAQKNEYGFTGTAPDVTLGAYKVFGCKGSVGNDVLIAAFNAAYEAGANIITASIGGPSGWAEEPWAAAVTRIVEAGVPCTVSAGNEGDLGLFYASTAANGKKVTAIASYDNTETTTIFSLSDYSVDGGSAQKFGYVPAEPETFDGLKLSLIAPNLDNTVADDGCKPYGDDVPDLSSGIALIRRGSCTFEQKAINAAAKGAKYLMIYNNQGGAIPIDVTKVPSIKSAGMVENTVGDAWIKDLKAGKKIVLSLVGARKAVKKISVSPNKVTGGALSGFTSWGPTWEMDVKPQFGAPGGNILSTYPLALGGYATLSGTSMSCPLTAGVYALIGQVRGSFNPEMIETVLAANANPQLFNDGAKFYEFLAPVAQQGAGLIQAWDAAYATTLLKPSSLSFNDTDNFIKVRNFTLSNTGKKPITFKLTHIPAVTMYTLGAGSAYPDAFPNEPVDAKATLKLSDNELTLSAGESATVEVLPTPPTGLDGKRLALWSGYVAINGTDGTSLSIPYQGLTGSLYKTKVLEADQAWITNSNDDKFNRLESNITFTIPAPGKATSKDILPAFAINMAMGSSKITAHLVPLTTCPPKTVFKFEGFKTIGQPAGFPALWSSRGVSAVPFDGKLADNHYAPPGKYKLVVRALHIFGNEKNKADWDVSESPSFRIIYK